MGLALYMYTLQMIKHVYMYMLLHDVSLAGFLTVLPHLVILCELAELTVSFSDATEVDVEFEVDDWVSAGTCLLPLPLPLPLSVDLSEWSVFLSYILINVSFNCASYRLRK